MTTYYISTDGADSDNGTSSNTPWATINQVDTNTYSAGDIIKFQHGCSWVGQDFIVPSSGTDSDNVITITDYDTEIGVLPILTGGGGRDRCMTITNRNYITVENIDFDGANDTDIDRGVDIDSADGPVTGITVKNCIGRRFEYAGFDVYGSDVSNIRFENCTAHNNEYAGIIVDVAGYPDGPENINIIDCVTHTNGTDNAAHHGIYLHGSRNSTIRGCESYNNGAGGIKTNVASDVVIDKNWCYDNKRSGIILSADSGQENKNPTITNNIIYSNANYGIQFINIVCDGEFYHNTIINNGGTDINSAQISLGDAASDNVFKNNIIHGDNSASSNSWIFRATNGAIRDANHYNNNCYYWTGNASDTMFKDTDEWNFADWKTATGSDAGSIEADPLLKDLTTDYHEKSTSPCINAGAFVDIDDDYSSNPRPRGRAPDIGAYEALFRKVPHKP